MNNPPTTQIVEQVDREAAADLAETYEYASAWVSAIRDGAHDYMRSVQAFTRHRIAALQSSRPPVADELCVRLGELLAKATNYGPWRSYEEDGSVYVDAGDIDTPVALILTSSAHNHDHNDAALIVEAINALPTLLADQARVAEAEGVIEQCRATFDRYAGLHMAKQPSDTAKAAANQEMADLCANFLSAKGAGG